MKKLLTLIIAFLASAASAQVIPSGPWGSINYWGVGGLSQVLNPGLAGQCLTTQGVGSAPIWVPCAVSSLSLLPSINTNQFYGNVSGQFAPPTGVDVNTILNTVGYDISRPPAVESIIYKSNVGPTFNWQTLPPSPQGYILTSGGTTNPPFWSPSPTQSNLSSICTTVGALLYFDTPSLLWKCLNPGTAGQVLQTGGASGNPSYLTLAATAPITYLTGVYACPTCATTTNGGALSATLPLSISAGGNISTATGTLTSSNDTNVTVTLGGTPTNALFNPVSLTMGWTGTLAAGRLNSNVVQSFTNDTNVTASISAQNATLGWTGTLAVARGGTGAGTQSAAAANIFPTPTRAGDVVYWDGAIWNHLAGNNSGTQTLTENASGVPSWSAAGAGTVTSVTCGTGLSGGTFTTTGTCAVSLTNVVNSLGANVALNNVGSYFDGPSTAQGTSGTWLATGQVVVDDTSGAALINCRLTDGSAIFSSGAVSTQGASSVATISLSGILASPAGNIRIQCNDGSSTNGQILFNKSGNSKDATLTVVRIL